MLHAVVPKPRTAVSACLAECTDFHCERIIYFNSGALGARERFILVLGFSPLSEGPTNSLPVDAREI